MTKADVLAKLEEYKDKPVIVGVGDEGIVLYSGIEGHWLFVDGENLVQIKLNSNEGIYGVSGITQQENPFIVITVSFDYVAYVKGFVSAEPGNIAKMTNGMTPIATEKSLDDIRKEIGESTIVKALSPRGNLDVSNVAPGTSYGKFLGSAISTSANGFPKYIDDLVTKNTETSEVEPEPTVDTEITEPETPVDTEEPKTEEVTETKPTEVEP